MRAGPSAAGSSSRLLFCDVPFGDGCDCVFSVVGAAAGGGGGAALETVFRRLGAALGFVALPLGGDFGVCGEEAA